MVKPLADRVRVGVPGVDPLLQGGFLRSSAILLRGSTGTGKTIFCMQYLHAGITQYNEPGVLISFGESREAIYRQGLAFGWDFKKHEEQGRFLIVRYSPHEVESIIKEGGGTIRDSVEDVGAKRLVIDSLTAYSLLFENAYRADESVLDLFEMLRKWGCTSLVTSEVSASPEETSYERLGFLSDGIINLYYTRTNGRRRRALEVFKMRNTAHSDRIHPFSIGSRGLTVGASSR